MLFSHVQQALPRLNEELDEALDNVNKELEAIRNPRASPKECKTFLAQLALNFYEVCKAAVNGHYEGRYFRYTGNGSSLQDLAASRRLRAEIQLLNQKFAENVRLKGHKYHIEGLHDKLSEPATQHTIDEEQREGLTEIKSPENKIMCPQKMPHRKAMKWVNDVVVRTRGRELLGNFNPLVIAELFWEQSSRWDFFANEHIDKASNACQRFLEHALNDMAPRNISRRLWPRMLADLTIKRQHATDELGKIFKDIRSYVINYNHYYTDTIKKSRYERRKSHMQKCLEKATRYKKVSGSQKDQTYADLDLNHLLTLISEHIDPNMDDHSSEEVLDCLLAIYKVNQKLFIANVTIQVIERHVLQGLEEIFCPLTVANLSDAEAVALASEPATITKRRDFSTAKLAKLKQGRIILREFTSTGMNTPGQT